jgi:cell wall-associated NlpC family hydrolase
MSRLRSSKLRVRCTLWLAAGLLSLSAQAAPGSADAAAVAAAAASAGRPATGPQDRAPGVSAGFFDGERVLDRVRNTTSDLVLSAMNFLGVPYRRGGTSEETGFDCSGFTRHVFENSIGRLLPRRSRDQALSADLLSIPRDDLKPGDLVFFNTMRKAFSHVGIYMGDGKFIHAPRTGSQVRVDDMREAYWTQRFNGARRLPELANGGAWKLPSFVSSATAAPLNAPAAHQDSDPQR